MGSGRDQELPASATSRYLVTVLLARTLLLRRYLLQLQARPMTMLRNRRHELLNKGVYVRDVRDCYHAMQVEYVPV